jgi:hypothetical protein
MAATARSAPRERDPLVVAVPPAAFISRTPTFVSGAEPIVPELYGNPVTQQVAPAGRAPKTGQTS